MIDHEDLHRVHEAALRLLGSVGCDIFDADALALLASRGAVVDGSRARLSKSAPRRSRPRFCSRCRGRVVRGHAGDC